MASLICDSTHVNFWGGGNLSVEVVEPKRQWIKCVYELLLLSPFQMLAGKLTATGGTTRLA